MGISNNNKTYRTGTQMETTTTTQTTTTTPQEKGNKMTRTEIATIHNWTLTRRNYDDSHDYSIQVDEQRPLVNLFVTERNTYLLDENGEYLRDEDGLRIRKYVHEIDFTPVSRQLTLEEAVEYADLVQKALQAAITFKHLIEATEAMEEEATV